VTDNTTASLINGQITSGVGSASPCSGVTPSAIPEKATAQWVSPNYGPNLTEPDDANLVWFYMRVAYGQEKKVGDYLLSEGIEVSACWLQIELLDRNPCDQILVEVVYECGQ